MITDITFLYHFAADKREDLILFVYNGQCIRIILGDDEVPVIFINRLEHNPRKEFHMYIDKYFNIGYEVNKSHGLVVNILNTYSRFHKWLMSNCGEPLPMSNEMLEMFL